MKLTHLAFAFSILCPTALAQEPPGPASQLKKLEPLVGDWQVSGTFKPTLDGEDIPVTTTASGRCGPARNRLVRQPATCGHVPLKIFKAGGCVMCASTHVTRRARSPIVGLCQRIASRFTNDRR